MLYAFVDTDNGGTPSNATPDTATSKYHTTSSWPANGARWSTITAVHADATIRALTDDLTIYCIGVADDVLGTSNTIPTSLLAASLTIIGDVSGAAWSSNAYTMSRTDGQSSCVLVLYENNVTILNVQMTNTGSATVPYGIQFTPASGTATHIVDSCHVRIGGSGTSTGFGIRNLHAAAHPVKVYNTIVQQLSSPGGRRDGIYCNTSNTGEVYNCVVEGFSQTSAIGIRECDTVTNCAVLNCTDDFSGGTMSYCASDDGDGTNAVTGLTWANEFEDYANGDFRLKSTSSLIGAGLDDPGSGLFSDDIAGTTRSDWDIGAFEYVAGTSTPYVALTSQRNYRKVGRFL